MYMLVVQLFTVYSVCSYITCQGQEVFLTRVVPSSRVCGSLCTYTTRCGSFIWDAATRSCHLHTGGDTETETMPVQKSGKGSQRMICHTRPCEEKEVCVPAEAGVKYLCLASGVTTSTTAAPITTTTTTLSTTSTATPITTTTTTLSTTTTATPITTITTTLSTTSTATPTTTTTTTLSTTTTATPITTITTTLSTTSTATPTTTTTTTLSTTTTTTLITTTTAAPTTTTTMTLSTTTTATPTTTTTMTLSTTSTATPTTTITTTLSTTTTTTLITTTTAAPITTTTTTLVTAMAKTAYVIITTTATTTTLSSSIPPSTSTTTTMPFRTVANHHRVSYTYVGCYQDGTGRVLPHSVMRDGTGLTPDTCSLHCHQNSFTYFGTQAGHECFCGDVIRSGYAKRPDTECNTPCTGDRSTACGGGWRISIYKIG